VKQALWWVLRIALAGVFASAAIPKLLDPGEFAAAIQNYRAVPDSLVGHIALFIPVFELVIAIGLLVSPYTRGAALLATLLLVVFGVAMAQARWRGIDLTCGCFGAVLEAKVSWLTVARTLGLGALSAVLLFVGASERHH
jgi:putative oxidoreductase